MAEDVEALVWRVIDGATNMHVLHAFVDLDIPEAVPRDGLPIAVLAERLNVDVSMLVRLLRAAAALDLCEVTDGACRLTSSGMALRREAASELRTWVSLMTAPWLQGAWSRLADVVRQPHDAFAAANGKPFWDFLSSNSDAQLLFDRAMAGGAAARARAAAQVVRRLGGTTIVDVGGGDGSFLAAILDACPAAHGILAERVATVEMAGIAQQDARIEVVESDFFVAVPSGGDVYILSRVLHDHDDDRAVSILRGVRAAMTEDAYLLVLESVVPSWESLSQPERLALTTKDLNMLVLVGGRERTLEEYEQLLASAGLSLRGVDSSAPGVDVLQAGVGAT